MNKLPRAGVLKRIVSLAVEIAAIAASLGFLIPLYCCQAPNGELNVAICATSLSLLGGGLLILIGSFLFFRYSKSKFRVRKIVDVSASLTGRVACLAGAIVARFSGTCSSVKWLEGSNSNAGWFAIAVFALFLCVSIKELVVINNDPEEMVDQAFEATNEMMDKANEFMNQQYAENASHGLSDHDSVKQKASNDSDIIEAEVVDKD